MLLWNYHDVAGGYDDRREVQLTIDGLVGAARGSAPSILDRRLSGNAYTAWLAMGSTQPPSAEQIARFHAAAKLNAAPRDLTRYRGHAGLNWSCRVNR